MNKMEISSDHILSFIVSQDDSVEKLLNVMTRVVTPRLGSGYAIVIGRQGETIGVVTDADLRKFSARHARIPTNIKELVHTDFISIEEGMNQSEIVSSLLSQMESRGWKTVLPVRFVPVLKSRIPVGFIDTDDLQSEISAHRDQFIVVGLGYVGLTLALAASAIGIRVIGIDSDSEKIESLVDKNSYISEPGIDNLLSELVETRFYPRKSFTELERSPGQSWNFILSVPTPLTKDLNLDTSYIEQAIKDLLPHVQVGDSIVLRSTAPIGTTREISKIIESTFGWVVGRDFYAISAPERTVEGNALYELRELPQIVGGVTPQCTQHGIEIFQRISKRLVPVSSAEVSETIKITSNAFRDYSFGFSNYLAKFAQNYNLDVNEIVENANFGYLRNAIPKPSPGVGGPCLSKDPYLLTLKGQSELNSPINSARLVNESMTEYVLEHLKANISELLSLEIVMLGLAFKGIPETNDIRNSPSMELANLFGQESKRIIGWDAVIDNSKIPESLDQDTKLIKPQVFLLMTNHEKNLEKLISLISFNKEKIWVFDPWRLIGDPKEILRYTPQGYIYLSLSHSIEILPSE
jgi:UDP-N-acetyl-D-mannosaminuronic acid dehydrogenase